MAVTGWRTHALSDGILDARDDLKRGIVTLCIGGGQGIALALEILS